MRFLVLLALLLVSPAAAHEWYESACCSGKDCKPVPDGYVRETRDGVLVKGFGILSETDPRLRWSQDERDHICASPSFSGSEVTMKLQCVYRKRKIM